LIYGTGEDITTWRELQVRVLAEKSVLAKHCLGPTMIQPFLLEEFSNSRVNLSGLADRGTVKKWGYVFEENLNR
jgi:hypothetical protein